MDRFFRYFIGYKKWIASAIMVILIVMVFLIRQAGVGVFSDGFPDSDEMYTFKYEKEYTSYDIKEITGIDINWANGVVTLKVSKDLDRIIVTETSANAIPLNNRLSVDFSGERLNIKWENEVINLGFFDDSYKNLVVEIPESMSKGLSAVTIKNQTGSIYASGLESEKVRIKTGKGTVDARYITSSSAEYGSGSGDINLSALKSDGLTVRANNGKILVNDISAETASFKTVTDDIHISGTVMQKLNAVSVMGNIDFKSLSSPQEIEMAGFSGDMWIAVPKGSNFQLEYSKLSGKLKSEFPFSGNMEKGKGLAVHGNGECKYNVHTTAGEINILQTVIPG